MPRAERIDQDDRVRNEPGSTWTAISPCADRSGGSRAPRSSSSTCQVRASRARGVSVGRQSRVATVGFDGLAATGSPAPVLASTTRRGDHDREPGRGGLGDRQSSRLPSGVTRTGTGRADPDGVIAPARQLDLPAAPLDRPQAAGRGPLRGRR